MTLTLELPDDVATELTRLPDGNTFAVAAIRQALLDVRRQKQHLSPKEILALPKEERDWLMREGAEAMAPLYEADLALPPHDRELTAFTALDGVDPVRETEEYLAGIR